MRRLLFLGKNLHLVLGRNCSDSEFGCMVDGRENVAAVENRAPGIRLVLGVWTSMCMESEWVYKI